MPYTPLKEDAEGMLEKGTLSPYDRPRSYNPDGSVSDMVTSDVGTDNGTYLIPTMIDAKQLTYPEAREHFQRTGEHFGKFQDVPSMEAYDRDMHQRMAAESEISKLGGVEPRSFNELIQYLKGER